MWGCAKGIAKGSVKQQTLKEGGKRLVWQQGKKEINDAELVHLFFKVQSPTITTTFRLKQENSKKKKLKIKNSIQFQPNPVRDICVSTFCSCLLNRSLISAENRDWDDISSSQTIRQRLFFINSDLNINAIEAAVYFASNNSRGVPCRLKQTRNWKKRFSCSLCPIIRNNNYNKRLFVFQIWICQWWKIPTEKIHLETLMSSIGINFPQPWNQRSNSFPLARQATAATQLSFTKTWI